MVEDHRNEHGHLHRLRRGDRTDLHRGGDAVGRVLHRGRRGTAGSSRQCAPASDTNLSTTTAATVRIHFPLAAGTAVCSVTVAPSGKPIFAKPLKGAGGAGEEFWVRIGNATKQLYGDDLMQYRSEHWG
ncbi:MAG: hypothetical protein M3063_06165 [Actinomycetota bacterium]|nr:hypothetical protein [Actinomycetota bacterium]